MIGKGRVHAVTMCLTERAKGIVVAYGMGVLRDGLHGFGLFAGSRSFGGLGFAGVHATVLGPSEGTIATRRTFARHTLAWGLTVGL
jgi:hypothetical protein